MATNPSKQDLKIKAGALHVSGPSGQSAQGSLVSRTWVSRRLVWLRWNHAGCGTKLSNVC
jgi:hypothetical protein